MKKLYILLFVLFLLNKVNAQWTAQNSGTTHSLNSIRFTDVNTGYAIGDSGVILKTINAGATWTALSSGTYTNLWKTYFTNANTGYIVGLSGTILKTNNGGNTWTALSSKTSNLLTSIYFTSVDTGYAVGFNGTILKTVNAGANWTALSSGTTNALQSVYFTDANTGYVVGDFSKILKTINAGATWDTISSGSNEWLKSVYFTNANTGYIVGTGGTILKTTDGGASWTALSSGTTQSLFSVYFTNATTSYAVGWSGIILKTSDGGASWTALSSGTTSDLMSVYFPNANVGYAVGYNGTILKTTSETAKICMVTVDSLNRNVVIWEKPDTTDKRIKSYNIYKESATAGVYNLIGNVPFNKLSVFIDASSTPMLHADRYKMSVIDTSGNESVLSPNHRTLHLSVSPNGMGKGYQLNWQDSYEGFNYYTYYIFRKTNNGNFIKIDSIQSNLTSFTDTTSITGPIFYIVAAVKPDGACLPSGSSKGIYPVDYKGAYYSTSNCIGMNVKKDLSLIAYYPFNGNANDESGNGNNGTVIGAKLTTDRFGNANSAYSLNGINNYISLDKSIRGIYKSSQFTIAGWFKPSNIYGGHIFSVNREPSIGAGQNTLLLQWSTTGFIALWCDSVAYVDYNSITRDTNSWHFFVLSVDNTKLSHLYFDGMFLAQSFTNNKIITSTSRMSLGQEWDGYDPSDFFKGYVDDISIYNRALTTKEIDSLFLKGGWSLNSTCSASYKSSIDTITGTAMFTNTTTGSNKYYWIFDDGDFSNTVSPTHKYSKDGIYRVSLTANDTVTGCQAKTSQEVKIKTTVVEPCRADFTYSIDSLSKTLTISNLSSKGITLNYWEFGDGALSNSTSPIHKYAKEGYYVVRLTVIDTITNCVDNKNVVVKILGNQKPCKANYTYSVDLSSQKIFFVDQSDVSANAKYFWDFNDGDSSIVENPNHTYALGGYFDVCLTIKDSAIKCLNTTCQTLKASDSSLFCQAQFAYSVDTITGIVNFYDNSKGKHNRWEWTYGDGTNEKIQNGKHKYIPGYYTVILNISDSLTGSKSYFVDVINIKQTQKLKAGFGYKNENGNSKGVFPVDFKGATYGDATEFEWDFGDSTSNSSSIEPTHEYTKEGTYEACLKVYNAYTGESDSTCQQILVGTTIGINKLISNNSINIYPNPTSDKFTIQFNNLKESYNLEILNTTGQVVLNKKITNNVEQVDLSGQAAGVYFVKLQSRDKTIVKKVIKQN